MSDFCTFTGDDKLKFTKTLDDKLFLRYENESKDARVLIFTSDVGLQTLLKSDVGHSDGMYFDKINFSCMLYQSTYLIT